MCVCARALLQQAAVVGAAAGNISQKSFLVILHSQSHSQSSSELAFENFNLVQLTIRNFQNLSKINAMVTMVSQKSTLW